MAFELKRETVSLFYSLRDVEKGAVSLLGVAGPYLVCVGLGSATADLWEGELWRLLLWAVSTVLEINYEKMVHSPLFCGFCLIGSKHGRDIVLLVHVVL